MCQPPTSPHCCKAHSLSACTSWSILKTFQVEHPGQKLTVLEICSLDTSTGSAAKETSVQSIVNPQSTMYLGKAMSNLFVNIK